MAYQQTYDPVYTEIVTKMSSCNYGLYHTTVCQHVYMFLKQYPGFTMSLSTTHYSNGTSASLLCLSGSVPMNYLNNQYSIPIILTLPQSFPQDAPIVNLGYKLDAESAKLNPLITNGNQVMNNYLHKWSGSVATYNLGGLCFNLSKSFEMHPPLGEAPKEEKKTVLDTVSSMTNNVFNTVKNSVTQVASSNIFKSKGKEEEKSETSSQMSTSSAVIGSTRTPEMAKREAKIEEVRQKLEAKFCTLNDFFEDGKNEVDPTDNYMTRAKQEMEETGRKLNKQVLVLESEKEEMNARIKEMRAFIDKNYGKEVTKDNVDDFVGQKEETEQTMLGKKPILNLSFYK